MNKTPRGIVFGITFIIAFLAVKLVSGESLNSTNILVAVAGGIAGALVIILFNPGKRK